MAGIRYWLQHPVSRFVQHLVFWVLSLFVFVLLFKSGNEVEKIDIVYAALFHVTILPAVYLHLWWLLPRLGAGRRWWLYGLLMFACIALFSWINYSFFQDWSIHLLPHYFFISYFRWWEVGLFFLVYIVVVSLLKLSRSWFVVNDLQRRLLEIETEKVQIELMALKAQVNPHFFFNTLNGIYSMTLDKDERLPATVLQLSHLMRYFLYESTEALVPLEKEWQVVQDYIALQKIRSANNRHMAIDVDGEIGDQVVAPLLLITFVENAFKHGAREGGDIDLLLTIRPERIVFRISNRKGPAAMVEGSKYRGVGLENVRRRLSLLYPDRHRLSIEDGTERFIVTLEWIV